MGQQPQCRLGHVPHAVGASATSCRLPDESRKVDKNIYEALIACSAVADANANANESKLPRDIEKSKRRVKEN